MRKRQRKKLTENSLLDVFREKHGFKYKYPAFPEYFTVKTPISIICPTHGEFQQVIGHHIEGQGCRKCAIARINNNRFGRAAWIKRFESVYGRGTYDYSRVSEDIQQHKKVEIFCIEHDLTFFKSPDQHWRLKHGCPKCDADKREELKKLKMINRREFERKARAVHGRAFEYSELPLEFSLNDNVIIFCNEHNHVFFCIAEEHLNGKGCPDNNL